MPIRTFDLPEELESSITTSVDAGQYENADTMVKTALSLLVQEEEGYEHKIFELRRSIQEGFDSGIAEGSTEEVFARVRHRASLPVRARA